jgi:hypothetical protein
LAGDAFLWNQFSKVSAPAVLDAQLGGFMIHEGHLSSDMTKYRKEICSFSEQPNILDLTKKRIEFLLWRIPDAFKHIFFKNIIRNSIN